MSAKVNKDRKSTSDTFSQKKKKKSYGCLIKKKEKKEGKRINV